MFAWLESQVMIRRVLSQLCNSKRRLQSIPQYVVHRQHHGTRGIRICACVACIRLWCMVIVRPPQSLQSNSDLHGLKTSKSLQWFKVAVSKGYRQPGHTWAPSKEDTAQSSTNERVPAERLNVAFLSFFGLEECPIDVEILDLLFYVLKRWSSYRVLCV